MFKKVIVGVLVALAVFVLFVSSRPSEFLIERSAVMKAEPGAVFAQVNDFHAWEAWSPWAKLDPESKVSFEGPASGNGAVFKWSGNSDVGEGTMTIVESRPNELIRIRLDFVKPFASSDTAEFTFKPADGGTTVTWSMFGHSNFMCKAIGVFVSMDSMLGAYFEKGLAQMRSIVEKGDVSR